MRILLICLGVFLLSSAKAYNLKYEKKLKKELSSVFETYEHNKCELIQTVINSTINITSEIYSINDQTGNQLGYFAVSQGEGRFETFDFLVVYDLNKRIQKVKILLYSSTYGYEIGSKRWLHQFKDHEVNHHFKYNDDIQAISGATVSGRGLTEGINRLNVIMGEI
ncbi:MAG: FMN-binding protein [Marinilabiliaceae bacterium]|nr:FMN-binding protein [Marinilabiliaceae bacterium]